MSLLIKKILNKIKNLDGRIERIENNAVIWQGEVYQANTKINLMEPLKLNKKYIMEFLGISVTYYVYYDFIYDRNNIQFAYSDGRDSFRYRFDILDNGKTININAASQNNAENTKLVKIIEVN